MTGGNNPSTVVTKKFSLPTWAGASLRDASTDNRYHAINPGSPVNNLESGRRMSRDGRYIAFDSYADLANEHSGTNQTTFATYLYDHDAVTPVPSFRRILPRSEADAEALGGDVSRYPGFTDYDINGVPSTFVLETRMNITPNGIIPTNEADGLNTIDGRPIQIYRYELSVPAASAEFTRLTKFPLPTAFLASAQPVTSNSASRMAFTLGLTELGTGNPDLLNEAFICTSRFQLESPSSFNLAREPRVFRFRRHQFRRLRRQRRQVRLRLRRRVRRLHRHQPRRRRERRRPCRHRLHRRRPRFTACRPECSLP